MDRRLLSFLLLAGVLVLLVVFLRNRAAEEPSTDTLPETATDATQEPGTTSTAQTGSRSVGRRSATGAAAPDREASGPSGTSTDDADGRTEVFGDVVWATDGGPVPNATVFFRLGRGEVQRATTDREGRFATRLPRDGAWLAVASSEDPEPGLSETTPLRVLPEDRLIGPLRLVLEPAHLLTVLVVDRHSGDPVTSAGITTSPSVRDTVPTDVEGRARLAVDAGLLALTVTAPGYANERIDLDVSGKRHRQISVALLPVSTLRGRVFDRQDGTPLGEVRVTLGDQETISDAAGRWTLGALFRKQKDSLRFERGGYQSLAIEANRLVEGIEEVLLVSMLPWGDRFTVRGTVLLPDASPASGALVRLRAGDGHDQREMWTDEHGAFRFEEVSSGRALGEIRAESDSMASGLMPIPRNAGDKDAIAINLHLTSHLYAAGVVVDEAGHPLSGARVAILPKKIAGQRPVDIVPLQETQTDIEGLFLLEGLPPDAVLTVSMEGYVTTQSKSLASESRDDLRIVMRSDDFFEGIVLDRATGQPIRHFTIQTWKQVHRDNGSRSLIPPDDPVRYVSENGFFRHGPIENEQNGIYITAEDYQPLLRAGIVANSGDPEPPVYELSEEKYNVLSGRIVDAQGRGRAGLSIRYTFVIPDQSTDIQVDYPNEMVQNFRFFTPPVLTDAEGRFEIGYTNNAVIRMFLLDPALPSVLVSVRTAAEDPIIVVPDAAVLDITIDRTRFPDADDVRLFIVGESNRLSRHLLTMAEEALRIGALPPADYTAHLMKGDQLLQKKRFTLAESERRSLRFGFE